MNRNLNVVLVGLFYFLLIRPVFDTSGTLFKLEFLLLIGLFGLGVLGTILHSLKVRVGTLMLVAFFGIGLLDLLYLMMNGYASFLRFLIVGLIGLVSLVILFNSEEDVGTEVEETEMVTEMPKIITDEKEVEAITREASGSVKKTFTKGMYVASRSGTTYHKPKCDWAKKINGKNRIWLVDETDASSKGYKKHSCF